MANMFLSRLKQGDVQIDYLTVTSMPTKTQYLVDDTLDLTGMVVTATFTDGVTADVTSAVTTTPANGATLSTEGTQAVIVTYGKATVSFNVTVIYLPASLESATWAQIKAATQLGMLSQFASVGDTKSITVGGNTFHLKLASINDGTGAAGSYYPNKTADFIANELLPDTQYMNYPETNVGGWNNCSLRTYLNETVYPTLPSDLKNVIVEKTHMRTQGNKSNSYISASDKLWLPTEWEIFGSAPHGGESSNVNKHYSIFSSDSARTKSKVNTSSAIYWYSSSPNIGNNTLFCYVSNIGSSSYYGSIGSAGIPLCLRIG